MNTITIDCGASFIKGAVFREGRIIRTIRRRAPFVGKEEEIFSVKHIPILVDMVRNMILELAESEKKIILCISNEMHGFLLSDDAGQPYTDYISWQFDLKNFMQESENSGQSIVEKFSLSDDIRCSGMKLRAGLPSINLYYLFRSRKLPDDCGRMRFYTLGTYILKVLAGGCEPEEHETNAAATGLFDLVSRDWNWRYIEKIRADRVVMPRIGSEIITFRLNGIEIYALPAIGDQQAALLGAGLTNADDLSFNLGTGAQVSRLADERIFSDDFQTRPYFKGKYLKTIPHIPSGRALNVYFRFIKSILGQYGIAMSDDDVWNGIVSAAENCRENQIPKIDLDFYPNAIHETPVKGGSITEIREYAFSLGSLMKAVMTQMADNFTNTADRIVEDPSSVKRLLFSGGIARRLEFVRNRVAEHYPNAFVSVAYDETMWGLYQYSRLKEYGLGC